LIIPVGSKVMSEVIKKYQSVRVDFDTAGDYLDFLYTAG